MSCEDRNYYNDSRVRATYEKWWERIDFSGSKALVTVYRDGVKITGWMDVSFEVCHICDGRGSHVNPSIDSNGLTADDFAEDPDFMEDYMSGNYDVPCFLCKGDKVIPVLKDKEVMKLVDEETEQRRIMRAEQLSEMRMGA